VLVLPPSRRGGLVGSGSGGNGNKSERPTPTPRPTDLDVEDMAEAAAAALGAVHLRVDVNATVCEMIGEIDVPLDGRVEDLAPAAQSRLLAACESKLRAVVETGFNGGVVLECGGVSPGLIPSFLAVIDGLELRLALVVASEAPLTTPHAIGPRWVGAADDKYTDSFQRTAAHGDVEAMGRDCEGGTAMSVDSELPAGAVHKVDAGGAAGTAKRGPGPTAVVDAISGEQMSTEADDEPRDTVYRRWLTNAVVTNLRAGHRATAAHELSLWARTGRLACPQSKISAEMEKTVWRNDRFVYGGAGGEVVAEVPHVGHGNHHQSKYNDPCLLAGRQKCNQHPCRL
jgi:hypothetical protein